MSRFNITKEIKNNIFKINNIFYFIIILIIFFLDRYTKLKIIDNFIITHIILMIILILIWFGILE